METGIKVHTEIPRGLLVAALLVVLLWGMTSARAFFVPVALSALLAFLMNPLVRSLNRYRVPEWISVTLSAVLLVLPFFVLVYFIVLQVQSLVQDLPRITQALNHQLQQFSVTPFAQRFHLATSVQDLMDRAASSAGRGISLLLVGLRTFLEAGSQIVLVLIFAVVMLASRTHLRRSGERLLAQFENLESAHMLDEVVTLIEQFLIARLIIIGVMGAASMITIKLFGVGYSFLLGLFIGVMTLVPEIGFLISLVPVIVVALAMGHSFLHMLVLVIVLFVLHLLEGNVLSPRLIGQKLNINALATFLGLFAGGLMWGVWGMFLSVPLLGVLRIALSAAPSLQPWGELLAERDDRRLSRLLVRRREARSAA